MEEGKVEEVIEEVSLFEDDKPVEQQAVEVAPAKDEAPAIPEKFKGKSMEDVIESYVNLEREFGNKSNEVGELRKLTDQILLNQSQQQVTQSAVAADDINEDVGFDDFIDDPAEAVNKVLRENPRLNKLEASLAEREAELSRKALLNEHEDAMEVVASPEFQTWVMAVPSRQRTLAEAHASNDVVSASDLLNTFKLTQKAATDNAIEERDAIAKGDLRKATVETGGAPSKTKKVYLRKELIELKIRDPKRYEAMSPEIHAAYAEGRVK